jgi:hypothetical protein
MKRTILLACLLLGACATPDPVRPSTPPAPASDAGAAASAASSAESEPEPANTILDPARVTKKPFGIRIDPATSPVQPERFSGYHTGADFEVFAGEDETTIRVPAICAGPIIAARRVGGYGGVAVQSCAVAGERVTVLYGHLSPSSLATGELETGDVVGRLGRGYGDETDGERPHLHLSIHRGDAVEYKGYVQTERELGAWMDPVETLDHRTDQAATPSR